MHLGTQAALALPDDASDDAVEALLRSLPATCLQDVIDEHPHGLNFREVGEHFGISHERVRQIEVKLFRTVRLRARRESLDDLVGEPVLEPWQFERSGGCGGPVRFAETHREDEPPPEHLAHLPLVRSVEDVASSFWCGPMRAEMTALRCIGRQTARHATTHRAPIHPLCASCTAGNAMRERVRVRDDVETQPAPETPTLTTAPTEAPERTAPMHDTTNTTPTKTPAAQLGASATTTTNTNAPALCTNCNERPVGKVWPSSTPKGTETWCGICRRIESMRRNGNTTNGTPQPGLCACNCGQNRAAVREGTPEAFAQFCGPHRKIAWDRVKKMSETPEVAAAWVLQWRSKPAKKKPQTPTSTTTRSAVVVPPKATPVTAPAPVIKESPASVAASVVEAEKQPEIIIAAPPEPKPEPPPAMPASAASPHEPKPVTTAGSIREGLALAARAKACAERVGGIDALEALVEGAIESGFVMGR